jgi:hypothetical protein
VCFGFVLAMSSLPGGITWIFYSADKAADST